MTFIAPPDLGSGTSVTPARVIASGDLFVSDQGQPLVAGGLVTLGQLYLTPFSRGLTTDAVQITANIAVGNARGGLYACDANGAPGALIVQSGSVAVAATTNLTFADTVISEPVWIAVLFSGAANVNMLSVTDPADGIGSGNILGGVSVENVTLGYRTPVAFGAFPASLAGAVFTTLNAAASPPDARLRAA